MYFIAIIPPAEICNDITAIKQNFASRFESKHALKVIPHITLKAPFKLPASIHEAILPWFLNTPVDVKAFIQELENFGAFPNKRNPVIFIEPLMNESLQALQKQLIEFFKKTFPSYPIMNLELQFHPDVTIAYRDLSFPNFTEAWKEYQQKEYAASFTVDCFHLLQHDGRMWNKISTYILK